MLGPHLGRSSDGATPEACGRNGGSATMTHVEPTHFTILEIPRTWADRSLGVAIQIAYTAGALIVVTASSHPVTKFGLLFAGLAVIGAGALTALLRRLALGAADGPAWQRFGVLPLAVVVVAGAVLTPAATQVRFRASQSAFNHLLTTLPAPAETTAPRIDRTIGWYRISVVEIHPHGYLFTDDGDDGFITWGAGFAYLPEGADWPDLPHAVLRRDHRILVHLGRRRLRQWRVNDNRATQQPCIGYSAQQRFRALSLSAADPDRLRSRRHARWFAEIVVSIVSAPARVCCPANLSRCLMFASRGCCQTGMMPFARTGSTSTT